MNHLRWNRAVIFCSMVLLFMILSRLIWMQLRQFPFQASLAAAVSAEYQPDHYSQSCEANSFEQPASIIQSMKAPEDFAQFHALWLSPGLALQQWLFCHFNLSPQTHTLKWQRAMFILTIMAAVLLARFLSRSWLVALIVGATLLSRGSLISRLGTLSADIPLSLFLTLWLSSLVHFLRTGAGISFLTSSLALSMAALFEPLCLLMFLALPLFLVSCYLLFRSRFALWFERYKEGHSLPSDANANIAYKTLKNNFLHTAISKYRAMLRQNSLLPPSSICPESFARGSLFRTIDVPFTFWVYHNRRWLKLSLANMVLFFSLSGLCMLMYTKLWQMNLPVPFLPSLFSPQELLEFIPIWLKVVCEPLDLHYISSLMIILLSCLNSPAYGLVSLAECMWILCITCCMIFLSSFCKAFAQYKIILAFFYEKRMVRLDPLLSSAKIFVWLEPIILTLGIVCIYHLLKVIEVKMTQQLRQNDDKVIARKLF